MEEKKITVHEIIVTIIAGVALLALYLKILFF